MALYKVNSGDLPLASDINQFVDAFKGIHDIGAMSFAPQLSTPAAITTASILAGTALGVGAYQYVVTFVTGYIKTNGTVVPTGETLASATITATTTNGNQAVNLPGIPVGGSTVVARNLYRTKVGGSTFYFLAQIANNTQTTYADTTADANLGTAAPPTVNTTGTTFQSDFTINKGVPTVWLNAGRTSNSYIQWNANGSSDYGMVFNVAGTAALTLQNSGKVTTENNTLDDGSGNVTVWGGITAGKASTTSDSYAHTFYGEGWFGDNTNGWVKMTTYNNASYIQAYNGAKNGSGSMYFSGRLGAAGTTLGFTFSTINFTGASNFSGTATLQSLGTATSTTDYNSNALKMQSSHWNGSAAVTYNLGLYGDNTRSLVGYDYDNGRPMFQMGQGFIKIQDDGYTGTGFGGNTMTIRVDAGVFEIQDNSGFTWFSVSQNNYGAAYNGYNVWTEDYTQRSYVYAYANTATSLAANTWTKVVFDAKYLDQLNEFDTVTNKGRFTASKPGIYNICPNVFITGSGSGTIQAYMDIYKNGSNYMRLYAGGITAGNVTVLNGAANIKLSAGDYIEVYVLTSTAQSVQTGGTNSTIQISRIS